MTINHHNNQRLSTSSSTTTTTQACAACKYQRRKCAPDCILRPYFPHDRQRQFLNAHKLFGVSNITKIIKNLDQPDKDKAMSTIIFQSDVRAADPVGGCYRIIREIQRQIEYSKAELELVLHQLAICRAQAQQQQQNHFPIPENDDSVLSFQDIVSEEPGLMMTSFSSNNPTSLMGNNNNNDGSNNSLHGFHEYVQDGDDDNVNAWAIHDPTSLLGSESNTGSLLGSESNTTSLLGNEMNTLSLNGDCDKREQDLLVVNECSRLDLTTSPHHEFVDLDYDHNNQTTCTHDDPPIQIKRNMMNDHHHTNYESSGEELIERRISSSSSSSTSFVPSTQLLISS